MVSFTDHFNAISFDILPPKTKIGKVSWYFNNSFFLWVRVLLSYKNFSFSIKFKTEFTFLLKAHKNDHSLASDWWEITKSSFKENARAFSKNSTTQENIKILRLKEDCKTYTKTENFKPELNQQLKT